MQTKSDFLLAVDNLIDKYPSIAARYKTKDPIIMQQIEAKATMLAMLSAQIETALGEAFEKVRDSTVLADAAMRGIIRKARPAKVTVTLTNKDTAPYMLSSGRVIFDSTGNPYIVDTSVTVESAGTGTFTATQVKVEEVTHTVVGTQPFYAIEIPESSDGSYLSGISVSDSIGIIQYRERYVNTAVGDRVFNVEADDRQRIFVRFGYDGVVGYQPAEGETITLSLSRSVGKIELDTASPFSLDYVLTTQESMIEMVLSSINDSGSDPIGMAVMRDLIKYPSVYDTNAVFLGDFEFLVRRSYSDAKFLSIWNETIQEGWNGASVDNINQLFVSVVSSAGGEAFVSDPSPPEEIASNNLTSTQLAIKNLIKSADDSYGVKFYTPVKYKISVTVTAIIPTAYNVSTVQAQISEVILAHYGETSSAAKKGGNNPRYKDVYNLLVSNVSALAEANSDLKLTIAEPSGAYLPYMWRFVDSTSLSISVNAKNLTTTGW